MPPVTLPDPPIGDHRIVLTPPTEDDADRVVEIVADPEIPRWTHVPADYTRDNALEFAHIAVNGLETGNHLPFLIRRRDDEAIVGAVGVHVVDERDLVAEIGYWAAPEARGNGYVTDAVRLLTTWSFAVLPWERLEISTAAANEASQRVAEKVGYHREAVLRSAVLLQGVRHDKVVFRMLPDEWEDATSGFLAALAARGRRAGGG